MQQRWLAAGVVLGAIAVALGIALPQRGKDEVARCGAGFVAKGARCLVGDGCPAPLREGVHGCDAPDVRVAIPAAAVAVGPSDWEAEGRVTPRTIRVQAFRIDAFEVTRGAMGASSDVARAASGVTRKAAADLCGLRSGRLPTEDEWIVAAVSAMNPPRRYPWGDTGAVCRRAAWGLKDGPCAQDADGPDSVGAHPDGDSPLGIHDLAGNVAEWVSDDGDPPASGAAGEVPRIGVAKGGDWSTPLAADLRIWARLLVRGGAEGSDPRVGFRCVYAP
jgi:formylglycine-generating enzyme required for sulfatase activity